MNKQIHRHTGQIYDRPCPEGQVGENPTLPENFTLARALFGCIGVLIRDLDIYIGYTYLFIIDKKKKW